MHRKILIIGGILCGLLQGHLAGAKTLPNGGKVQFDGTYYDFRAADGRKMVKMWVPPEVSPVRGMFIIGHGGGNGDSRNFPRDVNFRAYAVRHGFAVVGLHWFPGREVYEDGAKVFFHALDEFAKLGSHPEIAHLPFVIFGGSNGGATSYALACAAPERAICFTPNAAGWWNPKDPPDAAIKVPGLFLVGLFDPFMRGTGIDDTRKLVYNARARGARWCWIAEEKGHEEGACYAICTKYWDRCIELRLPPDADPAQGPVKLNDLPEESGWLADQESWDSGLTVIAPYDAYEGDKSIAGWLPDRDTAFLYRAVATYDNPLVMYSADVGEMFNPDTDYRSRLLGVAAPALEPGQTITVTCDTSAFPGWTKIEFYDAAAKLAEVSAGKPPVLHLTLDGAKRMYNIHALGRGPDGQTRGATPLYFYVRNPDAAVLSQAEKTPPVFDARQRRFTGSKTAVAGNAAAAPDDAVLVVYGLSAEQEKQFDGSDRKLSPFWQLLGDTHDRIAMTQKRNAPQPNNFSIVQNHDARLKIKAARSAAGLYLYFEVMDNRFVDVADMDNYYHYDALDVLLDSRSAQEIGAGDINRTFVIRYWSITLTTVQYQVAFGETVPPAVFRRSFADPWDMNYSALTIEEGKQRHGIEIDHAVIDKFTRAQEWFIPWSEAGNGGLPEEPPMGARLGFSPGYNDHDPGDYLPGRSDQLRWLGGVSPWGQSAEEAEPPLGWGDLEMGPML